MVHQPQDGAPVRTWPGRCPTHGSPMTQSRMRQRCLTEEVLDAVWGERARQFERYGTNDDTPDGSGPGTRWLLPFTTESATDVEDLLREDYVDFEQEAGGPTWVHLLREEVAEAFAESDPTRLEEELIQVAALAVSWVESLRTRGPLPVPDENALSASQTCECTVATRCATCRREGL